MYSKFHIIDQRMTRNDSMVSIKSVDSANRLMHE
jgi:hypothetical protein